MTGDASITSIERRRPCEISERVCLLQEVNILINNVDSLVIEKDELQEQLRQIRSDYFYAQKELNDTRAVLQTIHEKAICSESGYAHDDAHVSRIQALEAENAIFRHDMKAQQELFQKLSKSNAAMEKLHDEQLQQHKAMCMRHQMVMNQIKAESNSIKEVVNQSEATVIKDPPCNFMRTAPEENADKDVSLANCIMPQTEQQFAKAIATALQEQCPHLFPYKDVHVKLQSNEKISHQHIHDAELISATDKEICSRIDALGELDVCLNELVVVEKRNEVLQENLKEYQLAFRSIMDQHTILYQHFAYLERLQTQEKQRQAKDSKNQYHELLALREKCDHLEGILRENITRESSLTMVEDQNISIVESLRTEVYRLTQRIAVHEINESRLKRRYQFVAEKADNVNKQNELLHTHIMEIENSLKLRILYLENWKEGAEEMLERFRLSLNESVWKHSVERLQSKYDKLLAKHEEIIKQNKKLLLENLELIDLPDKVSRLEFMLSSWKASSVGANQTGSSDTTEKEKALKDRILHLETTLESQVEQRKVMEQAILHASNMYEDENDAILQRLAAENGALHDRVIELEKMFSGISRDVNRYKESAALATAQAHVLIQRKLQHHEHIDQLQHRLVEWAAMEDKNEIIGRMQLQLMQNNAMHQQLFLRYERVEQEQKQNHIQMHRMELILSQKSHVATEMSLKLRCKSDSIDMAIHELMNRDSTARIAEWDKFGTRITHLEEMLQYERERRQKAEKAVTMQEDCKTFRSVRVDDQCEDTTEKLNAMKSRIKLLESREQSLITEIESASREYNTRKNDMQQEDLISLNQNLLLQVEVSHTKLVELQEKVCELRASNAKLTSQTKELENRLQHMSARDPVEADEATVNNVSFNSEIMKDRGLEHAKLQEAAQATISGLKSLLEDKNSIISGYHESIAILQNEIELEKVHDRQRVISLNRNLYDEKKSMINKLKEAMEMIQCLERKSHDRKEVEAVQERHDMVLRSWKKAEIHVSDLRQTLQKYQCELDRAKTEKTYAEQDLRKALEEIDNLCRAEVERAKKEDEWKRDIDAVKLEGAKKDEKIKSLRSSLVQVKEEYRKVMDGHATEIAKLQTNSVDTIPADTFKLQEKIKNLRMRNKDLETRLQSSRRDKDESAAKEMKTLTENSKKMIHSLQNENKRLSQIIKKSSLSEKNTIKDLERQIRVLEAQNIALKGAALRNDTVNDEPESQHNHLDIEKQDQSMRSCSVSSHETLIHRNQVMEREIVQLQETLIDKQSEWRERLKNHMELYAALDLRLRPDVLVTRTRLSSDNNINASQDISKSPYQQSGIRQTTCMTRHNNVSLEYILLEKDKLLLDKDAKLMEVELELESCRLELSRVKNSMASMPESEGYRSNLCIQSNVASVKRISGSRQRKQILEYENIIENLKRIIKSLQRDNRRLSARISTRNSVLPISVESK